MATIKNKNSNHLSSLINYQLPDFVQEQHPVLSDFLQKYYYFLETSIITLSGENDFFIEEKYSSTNRFVYENGDLILDERTTKDFLVGETITGSESGVIAEILVNDFNQNKVLYVVSNNHFKTGEIVTGTVSGSTSVIIDYKPNIISSIDNFRKYLDVDNTLDILFEEFKKVYFKNYPNDSFGTVDQKLVIKKIKEINSFKGTPDSNKLFFNSFYNTYVDTAFPREKMLRISSGDWSYDTVLRIVTNNSENFNNCIGQKVYTLDSIGNESSVAYISSVLGTIKSNVFITELRLEKNIVGLFDDSSTVYCVDPVEDVLITGEIKNIIKTIDIVNDGAYYNPSTDKLTIDNIGTDLAKAVISDVGFGSIDDVYIIDGGQGYRAGDVLNFINTGTNGKYAAGKVAVVGGSILTESAGTYLFNLLDENETDNVLYEDESYIISETYVLKDEKIVLMDGGDIVLEDGGCILDSANTGEVTKVILSDRGNGYKSLPTITIGTNDYPTNGSGAKIIALSTNESKIGRIQNIKIENNGFEFPNNPDVFLYKKLIVKIMNSGSLLINDTFTSHNGKIISYDNNTNLLTLDSSSFFYEGQELITSTGTVALIIQNVSGSLVSTISNLSISNGSYITDKNKISNNLSRIQDGIFYQDFSYQLKTDIGINTWRNLLKTTIHPAGWNVFGAVLIDSRTVDTSITTPVKLERGIFNSSFIPILLTKIIGRRLGTVNQGQLNTEPNIPKFKDSKKVRYDVIIAENEYDYIVTENFDTIIFEKYNREVTLTSQVTLFPYKNASRLARKYNPIHNIQKYAFSSIDQYDNIIAESEFYNIISENNVDYILTEDLEFLISDTIVGIDYLLSEDNNFLVTETEIIILSSNFFIPGSPPKQVWIPGNIKTRINGDYYTIDQLSNFRINELPINASVNTLYSRSVPIKFNENEPFDFLDENSTDKLIYENTYDHIISENDKFTSNIPPPAEIYTIDVGT